MIAVADAGPLNYLVQIGAADLLRLLYAQVILPDAVLHELQHPRAPDAVRAWVADLPMWVITRPNPPDDASPGDLDPGERAVIAIAAAIGADRVLMDEWEGRLAAERRSLPVTGTLGILAESDLLGLCDFEAMLLRLRLTNFHVSDKVVQQIREKLQREHAARPTTRPGFGP